MLTKSWALFAVFSLFSGLTLKATSIHIYNDSNKPIFVAIATSVEPYTNAREHKQFFLVVNAKEAIKPGASLAVKAPAAKRVFLGLWANATQASLNKGKNTDGLFSPMAYSVYDVGQGEELKDVSLVWDGRRLEAERGLIPLISKTGRYSGLSLEGLPFPSLVCEPGHKSCK